MSLEVGTALRFVDSNITLSSAQGAVVLSGSLDIRVSSGVWNTVLIPPSVLPKSSVMAVNLADQGVLQNLPQGGEVSENVYREYTHTIVDTFKV
jgi:hypothetical protein